MGGRCPTTSHLHCFTPLPIFNIDFNVTYNQFWFGLSLKRHITMLAWSVTFGQTRLAGHGDLDLVIPRERIPIER